MNIPAKTTDTEGFLASEMRRYSAAGNVTKRSAVRLALASAIRNGILPKGSLIPTEKRLTTILGVSLGTVQAALQQLQQSSIIVRRRGDGSRVASTEALGSETWHFRLLAKATGAPMRVSKVDVDVEVVSSRGPWSDFFASYDSFILIRRRLIMSENVSIGAEMILPRDMVPGMEDIPPDELKMVNIRPFLAEKHGLLISRAEHQIETILVNDLDAKRLRLASDSLAFEITANTFFPTPSLVTGKGLSPPAVIVASPSKGSPAANECANRRFSQNIGAYQKNSRSTFSRLHCRFLITKHYGFTVGTKILLPVQHHFPAFGNRREATLKKAEQNAVLSRNTVIDNDSGESPVRGIWQTWKGRKKVLSFLSCQISKPLKRHG